MEVDSQRGDGVETVADIIPFLDFVSMLEKVSVSKQREDKVMRIQKYFAHFRKKFTEIHGCLDPALAHGDSIFSIVRLLCPTWDRERTSYGIKDVVMGRIFAKIHNIDQRGSDGRQLYNYKDPSIVGSSAAGDVAQVIYSVLSARSSHSDPGNSPTISELHSVLDQLAKKSAGEAVTQEVQVTILQGVVRRLGALEGKWLAKIILKKMDLGVNESTMLGYIHPEAKNLLDTISLLRVCQICNDPNATNVPTGKVVLFSYFKPMLCARLDLRNGEDMETDKVIISKSKKNPTSLPQAPFLVETKFDGERFQIHFERRENGSCTFKYFSRGGFEYSEQFNNSLTLKLQKQILSVQSFVVDGEMMAYNFNNKSFTAKGQSMDVKSLQINDPDHCPAFVAWDLVFLNGASFCHEPLKRRMELLQKVIQPKESVYYISVQKECSTMAGIIQLLDEAVENCEEGVIIKDQKAQYEPGQRRQTWLKLKPEYVEGYRVDDLDLLIVGGFYADTARRGGSITSLLLGLLDGEDVYPVSKVGCGRLKHHELAALVESLEPHFGTREIPCIKFRGKGPHVFIHPRDSVVVEVNASEINRSKDYVINYALRFPVISRVRRDKLWHEAMTVSEFHKLRESCKQGKMVNRKRPGESTALALPGPSNKCQKNYWGSPIKFERRGSSDEESGQHHSHGYKGKAGHSSSTKLGTKKVKKVPYVSPAKIDEVRTRALALNGPLTSPQSASNVFQGKVFHVMGSNVWVNDMKQRLKQNGAEIVMNPTDDTFAIVAEKDTPLVKRKMTTGKHDILSGSKWIENCISTGHIQDFVPLDLLFATETTKESFSKNFDIYGDSYTEELSLSQVKLLVDKVIEQDKSSVKPSQIGTNTKTCRRLCLNKKNSATWSFFANLHFAFHPVVDAGYKACVLFYGGKIVEDCQSREVTHGVMLSGTDSPDTVFPKEVSVVREDWIEDCVTAKKLLEIDTYKMV